MPPTLLGFARQMRAYPTDAERRLWTFLRNKQLGGLRFRGQQPIGPFIADFFCPSAKLIVELDGGHHSADKNAAYDEDRTRWLKARGYRLLRFDNSHVLKEPATLLEAIVREIADRPPAPKHLRCFAPPSRGG